MQHYASCVLMCPPTSHSIQLDGWHKELEAIYNEACCEETFIYEGVIDTLSLLRERRHPMCVCTNKPQTPADLIIGKLGLDEFFPSGTGLVVGGDFCPVRKPNPGHLLLAAEMCKAYYAEEGQEDKERGIIMVGDGHNDVKVAHNAGVPVLALTYGYSRIPLAELQPTVLLDNFDEIPSALLSLMDNPSY